MRTQSSSSWSEGMTNMWASNGDRSLDGHGETHGIYYYWARSMGTPKYFFEDLARGVAGQVFKERSNIKAWNHYVAKLDD